MTSHFREYERAVQSVLTWLHIAENDLLGVPAVTFNGEAGTIGELKLDSYHGICFTFDPLGPLPQRFYPVSTIKSLGMKPHGKASEKYAPEPVVARRGRPKKDRSGEVGEASDQSVRTCRG